MKAIGPTFAEELAAAGLNGLPFIWDGSGSISFDPSLGQEQVDAVLAVYEAHDPDVGLLPVSTAPALVAAGFGVTIQSGDITNMEGSYNILAALYLDVGQYMIFFSTALPEGYFATVQGDMASMRATEQTTESLIVEARDAPGGALAQASRFDVQVYRI